MSAWLGGEKPRTAPRTSTELQGVGITITKKGDRSDLKENDKKSYMKIYEVADMTK